MTSPQQEPATPEAQDAPAPDAAAPEARPPTGPGGRVRAQDGSAPTAQDAPAAPPASSEEAEAIRTAYGFEGADPPGAMLDGDELTRACR